MSDTEKLLPITSTEEELEKNLLEETDVDSIKNIINLFNLNIKKKDIIRTSKLNDLQDKVYDQIDKRLTHKADEFSNSDLLNYFKIIQDTINKADTTLNKVDTPSIQIVQNQLNVSTDEDTLSRESRNKIANIVQQFLKLSEQEKNIVDVQFEDTDDEYEQLTLNFEEE